MPCYLTTINRRIADLDFLSYGLAASITGFEFSRAACLFLFGRRLATADRLGPDQRVGQTRRPFRLAKPDSNRSVALCRSLKEDVVLQVVRVSAGHPQVHYGAYEQFYRLTNEK